MRKSEYLEVSSDNLITFTTDRGRRAYRAKAFNGNFMLVKIFPLGADREYVKYAEAWEFAKRTFASIAKKKDISHLLECINEAGD